MIVIEYLTLNFLHKQESAPYKKNFKKQYAGRPTKKYLKPTQQILITESIMRQKIQWAILGF